MPLQSTVVQCLFLSSPQPWCLFSPLMSTFILPLTAPLLLCSLACQLVFWQNVSSWCWVAIWLVVVVLLWVAGLLCSCCAVRSLVRDLLLPMETGYIITEQGADTDQRNPAERDLSWLILLQVEGHECSSTLVSLSTSLSIIFYHCLLPDYHKNCRQYTLISIPKYIMTSTCSCGITDRYRIHLPEYELWNPIWVQITVGQGPASSPVMVITKLDGWMGGGDIGVVDARRLDVVVRDKTQGMEMNIMSVFCNLTMVGVYLVVQGVRKSRIQLNSVYT
jgi:hypothetical protein